MENERSLNVEEVGWDVAREAIQPVNSELVRIIDAISPPKKFRLLKCHYRYGDSMLMESELHFPLRKGGVVSIHDANIESHIKESYGYNMASNPISISTKNDMELFFVFRNQIIPFALIPPGHVTGLWKAIEPNISFSPKTSLWGLTAGARSIFMLPKITEARRLQKINQELKIYIEKPKELIDHWYIFKSIANKINTNWQNEVFFFSKEWIRHLNDPAWRELNDYFLMQVTKSSGFWRNQYMWDLVFSIIQDSIHIKHSAYVVNLAKHLFFIASGVVPGFAPALDDQVAPINEIVTVFNDIYKLKYKPVIMRPCYLNPLNFEHPVYYSFNFHTALEFSPKQNERLSTVADIYELRLFIHKCLENIIQNKLGLEGAILHAISKKINFEFFHSDVGRYNEILESQNIPKYDGVFANIYQNEVFPINAPFVRGCVQISIKD